MLFWVRGLRDSPAKCSLTKVQVKWEEVGQETGDKNTRGPGGMGMGDGALMQWLSDTWRTILKSPFSSWPTVFPTNLFTSHLGPLVRRNERALDFEQRKNVSRRIAFHVNSFNNSFHFIFWLEAGTCTLS